MAEAKCGTWRARGRSGFAKAGGLATRNYPDFLEIGIDVWENVYDWHVAFQQALNVTRLADGRYAMAFMFTTLLLRADQAPDFVGYPFDTDSQGRTR